MKNYIKNIFVVLILFFFSLSTKANEISSYIKDSDFELKSTVSIFAKDITNQKIAYKKNEQKLLNPASTLKLLTFGASYLTLGEKYKFETILYLDNSNNLYIKLGADPLLTDSDLYDLFSKLKKIKFDTTKINKIYIDDSIIDKNPYPQCWMKEDVWPYSRAITPYIVNNNFTSILVKRSSLATKTEIVQNDEYKLPIINELVLTDKDSSKHSIEIVKNSPEKSSIITFKGYVNKDENIQLPVLKPEINFMVKLNKAIEKNEIRYFDDILVKKVPQNAKRLASVGHSIEDVSKNILYNSDNFSSEIVFKVAASKYYNKTATFEDSIKMFNEIYKDDISEGIRICDASGVSRTNFVTTEFSVNVLEKLFSKTKLKDLMAEPNNGTLKDRMLFLENNLKAKTGTLSQMSSISGIVNTKKGNDIIFSIIVQNSPKRKAILKNFENNLITILYRNY